MMGLRARLVLSHVLPFVVILPLVGLVILYLFGAQVLITDLSDDLEERANLIGDALARQPEALSSLDEAQQFIAEISVLVDGQIYLLDAEGNLLASSEVLDEMPAPGDIVTRVQEESFNGPEVTVEGNLGEQEGEAIVPVVDVNQQLVGIVGVRETLSDVASGFTQLRRLVLFTILGGMALGALFGLLLAGGWRNRLSTAPRQSPPSPRGDRSSRCRSPGHARFASCPNQLTFSRNGCGFWSRPVNTRWPTSSTSWDGHWGRFWRRSMCCAASPGEDSTVRAELLDGIETELTQMEPLLDDMAMLHDDVTGQQRLQLQPVEMSTWLAATLLPWRAVALEKGQEWHAVVSPDLPSLIIDPERMAQVVGNVLSNAIKYTPEDGEISVTTSTGAKSVQIHVRDNGPGIDPLEHERVFEPFYRSRSPQRFSEGLGLGLSIARSLVEAHGGTLTLESTPGAGSTFTISLPR